MMKMEATDTKTASIQRWDILDGIRGIAALYVTVGHCITPLPRQNISWITKYIVDFSSLGKIAVGIFIVLSGFVLSLPYIKDKNRFDIKTFLFRRSKRILPPYYMALIFSIPISILYDKSHNSNISIQQILSHVFLFQHFNMGSSHAWTLSANGPLWTVSVEYEIYFIYAFFLFWVWKKVGISASVIAALFLSAAPLFFLTNYDWYYPSYISLFAFGMALANSSVKNIVSGKISYLLFSLLSLVSLMIIVFSTKNIFLHIKFPYNTILADLFTGLFMFLIINLLLFELKSGSRSFLYKFLTHKISQFLGRISYSLYLIHYPILACIAFVLKKKFSGDILFILQFSLGITTVLLLATVFHRFFERPFLNTKS
jgi:peptidoglycan/LPS O-acetylase OafA/YrhL